MRTRTGLIALAFVAVIGIGGVSHAQSFWGWDDSSWFDSIVSSVVNSVGGAWNQTAQWYTGSGFDGNGAHGYETTKFSDSAGDILTVSTCDNGNYHQIIQRVCTSAPNNCGAVGTGFITDDTEYFNQYYIHSGPVTSHQGCNAQTPPDTLCAPPVTCTPQTECHGDGNLYDSCTGALVMSCAAGCSGGECNHNTSLSCTSENVCASDGNVHDSCTGGLVAICQFGCSAGKCVLGSSSNNNADNSANGTCTSANICYADGNVHDSCTGALVTNCPFGCSGGACNNQCVSHRICHADGNVYDSCSGNRIAVCKWGCTNGYCNNPPPASIDSFTVTPALVSSGTIDTASWKVKNVTSCTVSGTNDDSWQSNGDGTFSDPTSRIVGQTNFTLQCIGFDGSSVSDTAIVNLIPAFHER